MIVNRTFPLEHIRKPHILLQSQDCGYEAQRLKLGVSPDTPRSPPGLLARNPAISLRKRVSGYALIGIDEAGRGPLAGPVAVGGVRISQRIKDKGQKARDIFSGIKDSKQLTEKQREKWFWFLTTHPEIECAVAFVWPRVIDRINIRNAALLGARRVYSRLSLAGQQARGAAAPRARVLLDGGLFLPPGTCADQETIIKGDEKIPLIAAASIIAKVRRDRLMRALHKKYPQYRFDLHKGYGTALHREMIKKYGRCEVHRMSFRCA